MKKTLLAILCFAFASSAFAQDALPPQTPVKKVDQYIGVQINQLIRQVFNFNNTASTVINPYLLTYSLTSIRTGWGFHVGLGYNYNSSTTADGISTLVSKINDMQLRIGVEKRFLLSNAWETGAGLDLLYNINDDKTTSTINDFSGISTTTTTTTANTFGGGGMGWLRYHITPHILVGTEVSLYYTTGEQKQTIEIQNGGFGGGIPTNTDNKVSQGTINLPVAFFLLVKF
ncbi:MAG: hypothetical protein H0X33_08965 [Taibaiella sp.]|nr:hypothetical protein [Taibaiella sp.]